MSQIDVPSSPKCGHLGCSPKRDDGVVSSTTLGAWNVGLRKVHGQSDAVRLGRQRLLFPAPRIVAGGAEADAFETNRELFVKLGFAVEDLVAKTLIVNAGLPCRTSFDSMRGMPEPSVAQLAGERPRARKRPGDEKIGWRPFA